MNRTLQCDEPDGWQERIVVRWTPGGPVPDEDVSTLVSAALDNIMDRLVALGVPGCGIAQHTYRATPRATEETG